jgi:hypothetical protein
MPSGDEEEIAARCASLLFPGSGLRDDVLVGDAFFGDTLIGDVFFGGVLAARAFLVSLT